MQKTGLQKLSPWSVIRFLFCVIALFGGVQSDVAADAVTTNVQASLVAKLVEKLVSPVGPPPEEVKEYNGGRTDKKKLDAYLKAVTQGWIDPQVASAREKLIAMGTPIFPELVKHLGDKRYSYSLCYSSWVDNSVGYAVEEIMTEVVRQGFHLYGYKSRKNATGSNGQPSVAQMMREKGPEKYADRARGMTTKEVQKDYVQWYMEKEKNYGFTDKKQRTGYLGTMPEKNFRTMIIRRIHPKPSV